MGSVATAGAAGVIAGLGVALPLGAVGLLLLQEAMLRGWRCGAGAAAGVASVDVVYAALATVAGSAVAVALEGRQSAVQGVAAAVLAAVAVRGLVTAPAPDPAGQDGAPPPPRAASGAYWRFVAVTAVNPLTALYFLALATALGAGVQGAGRGIAFVAGVGAGSLAWQLVLAGLGSGAGTVLGARGRRWTTVGGNVLVLVLAAGLALGALAT